MLAMSLAPRPKLFSIWLGSSWVPNFVLAQVSTVETRSGRLLISCAS